MKTQSLKRTCVRTGGKDRSERLNRKGWKKSINMINGLNRSSLTMFETSKGGIRAESFVLGFLVLMGVQFEVIALHVEYGKNFEGISCGDVKKTQ